MTEPRNSFTAADRRNILARFSNLRATGLSRSRAIHRVCQSCGVAPSTLRQWLRNKPNDGGNEFTQAVIDEYTRPQSSDQSDRRLSAMDAALDAQHMRLKEIESAIAGIRNRCSEIVDAVGFEHVESHGPDRQPLAKSIQDATESCKDGRMWLWLFTLASLAMSGTVLYCTLVRR